MSRATTLAPHFSRAWAELAGAQMILADRLSGAADTDHAADFRAAAAALSVDRSLAIDDSDAFALAVRAGLEPPDARGARQAWLQRAVDVAPNDANVLQAQARLLASLG